METAPSSPAVVKEFRFYPESRIVTVVFEDDSAEDFTGEDNYNQARAVSIDAVHVASAELQLVKENGSSVVVRVLKNTPHETFEA